MTRRERRAERLNEYANSKANIRTMFNDEGEIDLFVKLGFQPVLFGEVISGSDMPNLMYLTTFSDTTSHVDHWNAFRTSEEWNTMKAIEKYKNTVSHIDIYLLYPSDYSDF